MAVASNLQGCPCAATLAGCHPLTAGLLCFAAWAVAVGAGLVAGAAAAAPAVAELRPAGPAAPAAPGAAGAAVTGLLACRPLDHRRR